MSQVNLQEEKQASSTVGIQRLQTGGLGQTKGLGAIHTNPQQPKRSDLFPKRKRYFHMPQTPLENALIWKELEIAMKRSPNDYHSGEAFAKPGTVNDPEALRAYIYAMQEQNPNIIDSHMFLGGYELEREAIAMTARLLGKTDKESLTDGFFMSGGTESINQMLWMARNKYFARRGIDVDVEGYHDALQIAKVKDPDFRQPVLLAPLDAHFAFTKGASLLGIGRSSVRMYGLDSDYRTDFDDLERVVRGIYEQRRDILLNEVIVGDTQKGRIQDVAAVTELIQELSDEYGREAPPTMVDAAAQYLFAAVMRDSPAYDDVIPDWDFRVPAVRAIVADPHKNQIPYNAGILLLRNQADVLFTNMDGIYLSKDLAAEVNDLQEQEKEAAQHNATIPTSRGGYSAAATWAYYLNNGLEGLREKKEGIWHIVNKIAYAIGESTHYELVCEPKTSIVSFHLKDGLDSAANHMRVYKAINEGPDDSLYISKSTELRVRSAEEVADAKRQGDKSTYTGLYVHVMEHNDEDAADLLIRRLEAEAQRL